MICTVITVHIRLRLPAQVFSNHSSDNAIVFSSFVRIVQAKSGVTLTYRILTQLYGSSSEMCFGI